MALVRQADVSRDFGSVILMYPVKGKDHIGAYQLGCSGIKADETANSEREEEFRHVTKKKAKHKNKAKHTRSIKPKAFPLKYCLL